MNSLKKKLNLPPKLKIMKKLLLILFVFAFSYKSFSQDIGAGAKIGMTGSSILASLGNSSDEVGFIFPGLHIGAYGNVSIVHFFKFQLEVLYSQKGGQFDNLSGNKIIDGKSYDLTYTDRLNYVDIPLIFMLHGGFSSFQIGLQPSFLVGQKTDIEGFVTDVATDEQETLEAQFNGGIESFRSYNNNEFSFLFGYQLDLPVGVNIGFRILYSLGNIYDIDPAKFNGGIYKNASATENNFDRFYRFDDARNVSAQISVGYTFLK